MYNKLFTKILDSSIWLESTATRIVWLTFIAAMDEKGFCQFASVANVAHRARVSDEEAIDAVACLEGPDENSGDPENNGRRIERVPGGWMVLNAEKHRDLVTRAVIQAQTRERVRKHRERKKLAGNAERNASLTPSEAVSEVQTRSEDDDARTRDGIVVIVDPTPAPLITNTLEFERRLRYCAFVGERLQVPKGVHRGFLDKGADATALAGWYRELDASLVACPEVIPDWPKWLWPRFESWAEQQAEDAEMQAWLRKRTDAH